MNDDNRELENKYEDSIYEDFMKNQDNSLSNDLLSNEVKKENIFKKFIRSRISKIRQLLLFVSYVLVVFSIAIILLIIRSNNYAFSLVHEEVFLDKGSIYQVELIPKYFRHFSYLNYKYEIADSNIATIDEFGTITATGVGSTTLNVGIKKGLKSKVVKINTEEIAISNINLMIYHNYELKKESTITMAPHQTVTLKTIGNSNVNLNISVNYSSNNPKVATVDTFGNITSYEEGTATITGEKNGIIDEIVVNVSKSLVLTPSAMVSETSEAKVDTVEIGTSQIIKNTGDEIFLLPTIMPNNASYSKVKWTSSNNRVATVNENGEVKMLKKGTAVITVKIDGIEDNCIVIVKDKQEAKTLYTLVFNANGGNVTPSSRMIIAGDNYGELPIPTRDGYVFAGWYQDISGENQVLASTVISGDTTIYAHWKANYVLTFNANGGNVDPVNMIITEGSFIKTLPTPSRSGYTFLGWYTSSSGGDKIEINTTISENMTVYAHWQENILPQVTTNYILTYNANGGNVSPTSKTLKSGSNLGNLPTPSRSGYTFLGWYTSSSGGTKVSANTIIKSNTVIYAHWSKQDTLPTPVTPTPGGVVTADTICEKVKNNNSIDYASFKELATKNNNDDYYAIKAAHDCANKYKKDVSVTKGVYNIYKTNSKLDPIYIKTNTNLNYSTIYIHDEIGNIADYATDDEKVNIFHIIQDDSNPCTNKTISSFDGSLISKNLSDKHNLNSGYYYIMIKAKNGEKVWQRNHDGEFGQSKYKSDGYRVKNGVVQDPMFWDYKGLKVNVTVCPIANSALVFQNAYMTTIVGSNNCTDCGNSYIRRGILVNRSNTIIQNVDHSYVNTSKKLVSQVPRKYQGLYKIIETSDITLNNCKVYSLYSTKSVTDTTKRSTYDLSLNSVANLKLNKVNMYSESQLKSDKEWGVTGTNSCKNVTITNSSLNRIDAHRGMYNLTVKNTIVGTHALTMTGSGIKKDNKIIIDGVTWKYTKSLIALRHDYGVTWNGSITITNSKVLESKSTTVNIVSTNFGNNATLAFKQPIYNPSSITINGLNIQSSNVKKINIISASQSNYNNYYLNVFKNKYNSETNIVKQNITGYGSNSINNYGNE